MNINGRREQGFGWTTAALVAGTIVAGLMAGCGGGGSPPPPAHSGSYFPVRGTADTGGTVPAALRAPQTE